jgi:hypothetical protein
MGTSFSGGVPRAVQACLSARGVIEDYCGQPLLESETIEVVDALFRWPVTTVFLARWPVTAVASVAAGGVVLDAATWSFRRSGILELGSPPSSPVTVTYTAGWNPLPQSVRLLALRVASRLASNPADHNAYANVTGNEGIVESFDPRLLTGDERETLDRYRAASGIA